MSIDYPVVMDDWYDDATEGDLSGDDVTGGRVLVAQYGKHDAAMEYYRLSVTGGSSRLTKGDARAYVQAMIDDSTI